MYVHIVSKDTLRSEGTYFQGKERELGYHGNVHSMWLKFPWRVCFHVMAYSHYMEQGLGQVQRPGLIDPNILYRNIHTSPRQVQEPVPLSPIVTVEFPVSDPVSFPCSVNKPLIGPRSRCVVLSLIYTDLETDTNSMTTNTDKETTDLNKGKHVVRDTGFWPQAGVRARSFPCMRSNTVVLHRYRYEFGAQLIFCYPDQWTFNVNQIHRFWT